MNRASCCALGRYGARLLNEEMTDVRNVGSWPEPSLRARMEKYTAQRERHRDLCRAGSIAPTFDLTR